MKKLIHIEINLLALGKSFSQSALAEISAANIGQDALKYQLGHDHYHYDNSSFSESDKYCESLRQETQDLIKQGNPTKARIAFGKLTHTVQDLYAHSNYVNLFREAYPAVAAEEIDPLIEVILTDPKLISGKLYYPWEAITFIPGLPAGVAKIFPADSHAMMNKDDPTKEHYEYAFFAAVKRTVLELEKMFEKLTAGEILAFTGKTAGEDLLTKNKI